MKKVLYSIALVALLASCSQTPKSRYSIANDTAPQRVPTEAELTDPVPRHEPFSRQGNRTYTLFGERYDIIDNVQNYSEQGVASWYGRKFHGHLTSNGEYFDMFNMTAAHKSLPLPIYVKVTNLDNGRNAIVRVNDRGPFHPGRIIDLSYAAAYRLGVTETGVANVHIEVVTPPLKESAVIAANAQQEQRAETEPATLDPVIPPALLPTPSATMAMEQLFVQVTATSSRVNAEQLGQRLHEIYALNATMIERDGLHRLLLGPFSELEAARWLDRLQEDGYSGVFRIQEAIPPVPEQPKRQLESSEVH